MAACSTSPTGTGTTARTDPNEQLALLLLKFSRDILLYCFGWKDGVLAYTLPGTRNVIGMTVFAPAGRGDWLTYDWVADGPSPLALTRGRVSAKGASLVLHAPDGDVVYTRRP